MEVQQHHGSSSLNSRMFVYEQKGTLMVCIDMVKAKGTMMMMEMDVRV